MTVSLQTSTHLFILYRGAELINQILVTRVQEQREDERKILENIKKKMEILRRKRNQGSSKAFTEPDEHFQGICSDQ